MKKRVLVLCTGNSARSQMLAAILAHGLPNLVEVESAGTEPAAEVHPLARRVLAEAGIPLRAARPRHVREVTGAPFDLVVTVCDRAKESCPVLPGGPRRVHCGYPDPAAAGGTEEERLETFRAVRDSMLGWTAVAGFLAGGGG